ncbi:HPr family phosphocarrier protein [Hominifimenecus sp. rT4P-3]|uniref:HPr family phosphocarrier protein n=1 Tax=Hominifimenecus sp. rT4P-3 TaxID=3242979 RepID=UPI003DA54427
MYSLIEYKEEALAEEPERKKVWLEKESTVKEFKYTITEELGLHARPAGIIAKAAKAYKGTVIMISKGPVSVKATQLMKMMSLAAKQGDEISVSVEGDEEEKAAEELELLLKENL